MSRQKGYMTNRAVAVATVQGECFCFQLYGWCTYGDTVRRAGDQGRKYAHVDKHGKTVTSGVLTTVPNAFLCTRCKAQGKHWSFHCNEGGGPPSRGDRGGRGSGGGGSAGGRGGAGGGSPGVVEADVVQLAEDSVATADTGVGEACSEEGWRAPSPGRSRSRSLVSALQRARLLST
jgi:hypothetical protein